MPGKHSTRSVNLESILRCPDCGKGLAAGGECWKCKGCGQLFPLTQGIPSFFGIGDSAWKHFFDHSIAHQDNQGQQVGYANPQTFRQTGRVLRQIVGPVQDAVILDVGCGNGGMSGFLTEGNLVVGVDFSLSMLGAARGAGMTPLHADASRLPLIQGSFDLILSIYLLQHLDDARAHIDYLKRFLAPGGRLVVCGLNRRSVLRRIFRAYLRRFNPGLFELSQAIGRYDPFFLAGRSKDTRFQSEIIQMLPLLTRGVPVRDSRSLLNYLATTFFLIIRREKAYSQDRKNDVPAISGAGVAC